MNPKETLFQTRAHAFSVPGAHYEEAMREVRKGQPNSACVGLMLAYSKLHEIANRLLQIAADRRVEMRIEGDIEGSNALDDELMEMISGKLRP